MQRSHTHIPGTNHVPRGYIVAAILSLLFMVSVSMRHLVFVTLCGWLSGTPDSHPHRVTNTKSRKDTFISPADGHIVARNMWRK